MMISKHNPFLLALTVLLCWGGSVATPSAQALSLKELSGKQGDIDRTGKSTKVTADMMDIDFQNNIATLTGEVDVDDPAVRIKCDKMMIYLQEKEGGKAVVKENSPTDGMSAGLVGNSGKELRKIVCIGNVIILRKLYDKNDIANGEQRATAGNAVYNVKENMIVLTENTPTITRGKDIMAGWRITFWLDSERVKVEKDPNGPQAVIQVENIKALQKQEKTAPTTQDKQ